jgi:acetylornithine deacetylase
VRTVESAVKSVLGAPSSAGGAAYSTDGCHLGGRGGLPCVVLGPGSIARAHTADEWVDLQEVSLWAGIYTEIVRRCAAEPGSAQ